MAAQYRSFAAVGGPPVTTLYTDTFNRANTTQGLGAQYIGVPRSSLQSVVAMPMCNIQTGQMQASCVGAAGGSQVPGVVFIPVALINSAVYGVSQFAEMTWQSHAGGDSDIGPAVMFTGDFASQNQVGYQIEVDAPNIVLNLMTTARTQLATAAYAPSAGDVWRLEVRPTAAANALTVKVNGATLITFSDTNAARPVLTGYPAIWNWANAIGATDIFSRFSAGVL